MVLVLASFGPTALANAEAVVSWNKAPIVYATAAEVAQTILTSIFNTFVAFVGVIPNVINSFPSVFCGIVSSRGMIVDPVATSPSCAFTIWITVSAAAAFAAQ